MNNGCSKWIDINVKSPKEGQLVICINIDRFSERPRVAKYRTLDDESKVYVDVYEDIDAEPTHWIPLPSFPERREEK